VIVKRRLIVMLALAAPLSVLVGACGGGGESKDSGAKPKATQPRTTQASVTAGRDVFVANCARATVRTPKAALGRSSQAARWSRSIRTPPDQIAFVEGHSFPPFRDRLSPEEIRDVVEYTRSAK
jgi:mono/diheme cytochrome c family protein